MTNKSIEVKLYYGYISQFTINANLHPKIQKDELHWQIRNCTTDVLEIACNSSYVLERLKLIEKYSSKPNELKGILWKDMNITLKYFEVLIDGTVAERILHKGLLIKKYYGSK